MYLGCTFLVERETDNSNTVQTKLKEGCPIDDEIAQKWLEWKNNLITLEGKSLPRSMKQKNFGSITDCLLNHFSECQSGYGQCSYIRFVNHKAQIHCCLLIGKSRVTPLKFISIPRPELTAAALSV